MVQKIFTYGLSGSGKDTIANYLKSKNFIKLRIANTIKQIICESKVMTFDELEEQKRTNPSLRELHHIVSTILDNIAGFEQSSLNRLKMLIDGTAFDYEFINNHEKHDKIIFDVRSEQEMIMLLNAGWIGIFLSRTSSEYKHSGHFTENDAFKNGLIEKLVENFDNQIYLVLNDDKESDDIKLSDYLTKNTFITNGSKEQLLECIDDILGEDWKNKNEVISGKVISETSEQHSCYYFDETRNLNKLKE